jgi:hypothetical protein
MAIACKLCIARRGLTGSEIASLPQTDQEFREHLRVVHGFEVVDRQSEAEALAGMKRIGPGFYHGGKGDLHVSAREVLAHLGWSHTLENEEALFRALLWLAGKHQIPEVKEVVVCGD